MSFIRSIILLLFLGNICSVSAQLEFDKKFGHSSLDDNFLLAERLKDKYIKTNLDSLRHLADYLLNRDDNLSLLGYRYLGSYYSRVGKLSEAIKLFHTSVSFFDSIKEYRQLSEILNEIGNTNYQLSNFGRASENYIASLRYGLTSNDPTAGFNGILGLGKSICANGDTTLGIKLMSLFLERCIAYDKFESAADASAFLGMVFSELGDKPVSKMYYEQSVGYAKKSRSKTHIANAVANQAIVDVQNGEMKSAENNFLMALKYREELGAKKPVVDAYFNLGTFNIMIENYDKAFDYLMKASTLSKDAGMIRDEYDAIEVILLALPHSISAIGRPELEQRFKVLGDILSRKKEISFEIKGLSSQIAATGSASVLTAEKMNKTLWLWVGSVLVAISSLTVYLVNRPKINYQFKR